MMFRPKSLAFVGALMTTITVPRVLILCGRWRVLAVRLGWLLVGWSVGWLVVGVRALLASPHKLRAHTCFVFVVGCPCACADRTLLARVWRNGKQRVRAGQTESESRGAESGRSTMTSAPPHVQHTPRADEASSEAWQQRRRECVVSADARLCCLVFSCATGVL
eukprot:360631-Chlamydomonas_euryale.AAC.3